jgi:hypothetical protein
VIRAARSGDGGRPDWPTRSNNGEDYPQFLRIKVAWKASTQKAPGAIMLGFYAQRRLASSQRDNFYKWRRLMSIYASAVALWSMATALFLTAC